MKGLLILGQLAGVDVAQKADRVGVTAARHVGLTEAKLIGEVVLLEVVGLAKVGDRFAVLPLLEEGPAQHVVAPVPVGLGVDHLLELGSGGAEVPLLEGGEPRVPVLLLRDRGERGGEDQCGRQ